MANSETTPAAGDWSALRLWMKVLCRRLFPQRTGIWDSSVVADDVLLAWWHCPESVRNASASEQEAWLCGVAKKVIAGYQRQAGRAKRQMSREQSLETPGLADSLVDSGLPPPISVAKAEWRLAFWATVDDLPERQREVLQLRLLEHFTHNEIAIRLGCARQSVTSLMRRGLLAVADRIGLPDFDR